MPEHENGIPPRHIVVLAWEDSPTCDIYLRHRLSSCALPVAWWTLGEPCPVALDNAFLIVVRYVDHKAMRHIESAAGRLAGIAWLLDDDIGAAMRDWELPRHYRLGMAYFWLRYAKRLARQTGEIWAASNVLAARLAALGPVQRIDPLPAPFALPRERIAAGGGPFRIFYHGQKTHGADHFWLRPVVAAIHQRFPEVQFEIAGGHSVRKLYRGLDRVDVRPLLPWPDYLARSLETRFAIGLAPLMPTPFNRARSWVKYLDIARFGAVGIFADGEPYDRVVRHGENGLLCPAGEPEAWIDAISRLVEDDALRRRLAANIGWPENIATPPALEALVKGESGR